jgi:ABC-type Fe3+/spermidine/putrescine transport system ATPase subunit
VLQIGPPTEIYERPTSRVVASFIGSCNVVEGARVGNDVIVPAVGAVPVTPVGEIPDGSAVGVAVRPERISITIAKPAAGFAVSGALTESIYIGDEWRFGVLAGPQAHLVATVPSAQLTSELATAQPGDTVWLNWRAEDARALAV